ncbi:unnamed protein product [Larinioides sclopetarius]|uniref:THAP-type domain-containing protein n=1 Tax=Larinioides sclopetarius TaxID=280406 RepID=A0AAV1Z1G0_9ARAC
MVHFCCAFGCKEKGTKDCKVSFHSFPKDEGRRRLWMLKVRRENFTVSNSTKICSKHFTPDSFDKEKFGGTWLKKTAVPTLFSFPDHLQPKNKERNPPKNRNIPDATELLSGPEPLSKEVQKRWKNMKDNYVKAIKNEGGKSDARKTKRPYIHQKHMIFLREIYGGRNSGTTSGEEAKDRIPFELAFEIKKEPMDYLPTPSTSTDTTNEEFILPQVNSWSTPDKVVEPQFTLSVASLASSNAPETGDDEQLKKKRKSNPSPPAPSTNSPGVKPQSPICNFGESSNPDSSKEPRKDQLDAFGEYIVAKLRSLDRRSSAFAQKAIVDIIFEAEMGKFLKKDCEYKVLKYCAS